MSAKALYKDLREESKHLRAIGVKFSAGILVKHSHLLIQKADDCSIFHSATINIVRAILSFKAYRWAQRFVHGSLIVHKTQTRKHEVILSKIEYIQKCVALHFGDLKPYFNIGLLQEYLIRKFLPGSLQDQYVKWSYVGFHRR